MTQTVNQTTFSKATEKSPYEPEISNAVDTLEEGIMKLIQFLEDKNPLGRVEPATNYIRATYQFAAEAIEEAKELSSAVPLDDQYEARMDLIKPVIAVLPNKNEALTDDQLQKRNNIFQKFKEQIEERRKLVEMGRVPFIKDTGDLRPSND